MRITAEKGCVKFWLRILRLPDDRYVKLCYNMLKLYDNNGHVNWVTKVRTNLYENGLGYIWKSQLVHNEDLFFKEYTLRQETIFYNHGPLYVVITIMKLTYIKLNFGV